MKISPHPKIEPGLTLMSGVPAAHRRVQKSFPDACDLCADEYAQNLVN
jgi:O-methyltransferase involved in polyketide biosynthesis